APALRGMSSVSRLPTSSVSRPPRPQISARPDGVARGTIRAPPGDRKRTLEMEATSKIWMNGELVDWADATVHVGAHGLHYGSGVFEGIRAYETPRGTAVFRLTEHLARLENSAKLLYMDLPFSRDELKAACWDLIGANGLPA